MRSRSQRRRWWLRRSTRTRTCRTPLSGCSSVTATLAKPTSGTDALKRLSGSHRLASRWSGSARGLRREGSGTGTGAPVPAAILFLFCLLSEASRGEGLGIPSPLPGCHFCRRGDLQGFLPGQGSTASSSHSPDAANEAGVGVFRTFPRWRKSAASAAIPSPIVPASVSSWTRAAYEDLEAGDEPAELEEDAELLIEEVEDPSGWSVSQSASGLLYYWHQISRRSVWHLPPGASARKKKGRRKRKQRRKRRTPRTSSRSLCARARRRQRQWHVSGFPGSGSGYASVLCALLGSTADTVHVSVFGGFWYNFTYFLCILLLALCSLRLSLGPRCSHLG